MIVKGGSAVATTSRLESHHPPMLLVGDGLRQPSLDGCPQVQGPVEKPRDARGLACHPGSMTLPYQGHG